MRDTDRAWLAGLFDGEGCISFVGKNSVTLLIGMTDEDLIDRVLAITGVGAKYHEPRQTKDIYVWQVGNKADVVDVLQAVLPWLGERRSLRAIEALDRLERVRNQGECKRGHLMEGENLYVSPGGARQCRTCSKVREVERQAKRYPSGIVGRHSQDCQCDLHMVKT